MSIPWRSISPSFSLNGYEWWGDMYYPNRDEEVTNTKDEDEKEREKSKGDNLNFILQGLHSSLESSCNHNTVFFGLS